MAIQGICRVFERNLGGWSPRHSLRLTGSCQPSCGLSQSWPEDSLAISEFGVNSPQRATQRWPKKTAANFDSPRHIRRMDKVEERERSGLRWAGVGNAMSELRNDTRTPGRASVQWRFALRLVPTVARRLAARVPEYSVQPAPADFFSPLESVPDAQN